MDTPEIKRFIHECDPTLKGTEREFKAAVLLVAMLEVGPSVQRLWMFTGYKPHVIMPFFRNWERGGLIKRGSDGLLDGYIYIDEWDHPKHGVVAFWCDVLVGTGMLRRLKSGAVNLQVRGKKDGKEEKGNERQVRL